MPGKQHASQHFIRGYDKFIEVDRGAADERFNAFEVGIARALLRLDPKRIDAMMMLGHALTRSGQHKQALAVDQKLAALCPDDPNVHYNLACSLSNLDRVDESLAALEKSLELGYRDFSFMLSDPDLENTRKDPRFKRLLDRRWGKRS
jgi:tetratricopeptide (TPR) repeat protein